MDVFISWNKADLDVKNALVDRLRQENITCWVSDEQCMSAFGKECPEGIRKCGVFIAIISDASMSRGYTRNEIIAARSREDAGLLNILVYKVTDADYTEEYDFYLNHISHVTGNFFQRKETFSGESCIDQIVRRTKLLLKRREEGEAERPFMVRVPEVDGTKVRTAGYCVPGSRDDTLAALEEAMDRSNVAVLNELVGYGKRTVIRQFALLHKDRYARCVMVSNTHSSLRDFILDGLTFSNINPKRFENLSGDALIDEKLRVLEKLDRKTLLVITGIRDEDRADQRICERLMGMNCSIILAVDGSADHYRDWFPVITLGRMSGEHLTELFFHYYPYADDQEQQLLAEPLEAFFRRIGGHTQAVVLTASVLSSDELRIPPEEVPQYLSVHAGESARLQDRIMDQLSRVLDIEQLSEGEIAALLAAAHIAAPQISETQYRSVLERCGVNPRTATVRLEKRRWLNVDRRSKSVSVDPMIAQLVQNKYADNYDVLTGCFDFLFDNSINVLQWNTAKFPTLGFLRKLANLLSNARMPEAAMLLEALIQYQIDEQNFDYDHLNRLIAAYERKYGAVSGTPVPEETDQVLSRLSDLCKPYLMGQQANPAVIEQIMEMIADSLDPAVADDYDEVDFGDLPDGLFFDGAGVDGTDFDLDFDPDFDLDFDMDFEDFSEDPFSDEEADTEELPRENNRETFEQRVRDLMEGGILSQLKLIASNVADLLTDFSRAGADLFSGYRPDVAYFSPQEMLGLSDDAMNIIRFYSKYKPAELDDLDDESLLTIDTVTALEAFFRKDFAGLAIALNSALLHLDRAPSVMEDEYLAMMLSYLIVLVASGYTKSGAPRQAIVLCEKVLQYDLDSPWQNMVLQQYIAAHRSCGQYTDALFDAYETILKNIDTSQLEAFDSKTEQAGFKKTMQLVYAQDLARAGRLREARNQFEAAQRLDPRALPDEMVLTADSIAESLVRSGAYDQAAEFLNRHFDSAAIRFLRETCKPDTMETLENCILLKELSALTESDFASDDGARKYRSYYEDFSRKNNSLQEKKYYAIADKAAQFDFSHLTDEQIAQHSAELRRRAKTEKKHRLAPEAFALASEAGVRVLGYRHHYVQYMGAAAMADDKIAEILNGEGKTYTIVLTAYLNTLYDQKVCIVDASDYLSRRNHDWMHGVYELLGVSHEYLADGYAVSRKKENQQADVTYACIENLVFGVLRSESNPDCRQSWFRLDSVIIDEADTVLVDSAKQSYTLTRSDAKTPVDTGRYLGVLSLSRKVGFDDRYYIFEKKSVRLQPGIYPLIEREFGVSYEKLQDMEKIKEIEKLVSVAIYCHHHMTCGEDYFIHEGEVVRENIATGRFMPIGMPYRYFLRAINGLESFSVLAEAANSAVPMNTVCIRSFFRQFASICGTTATAVSFRNEFREIYDLDYVAVPPYRRSERVNRQNLFYTNMYHKDRAILGLVLEKYRAHQPVLIATQGIRESGKYARYLQELGVPCTQLDARNSDESSDLIALAGMPNSVLIATAIINRGTDIKLGGDPELRTRRDLVEMGVDVTDLDALIYGVPTQKQQQPELYQRYRSIYEKNKVLAAADRKKVVEAGGLCVIGTSFFPEPRAEQQMRGRCGRQGEVGESWAFASFEDESLQAVVSDPIQELVQSLGTVETPVNTKVLDRTLQHTQQVLHSKSFAEIRQVNKSAQYLDEARKEFMGRKYALAEKRLTPDDIFREWAANPKVLQWLAGLQNGEVKIGSRLLTILYSRHPRLQKVRGRQAERILFEAAKAEFADRESVLAPLLRTWYVDAWTSFVEVAVKITGNEEMKEKAAVRILKDEKDKLLIRVVDNLVDLR